MCAELVPIFPKKVQNIPDCRTHFQISRSPGIRRIAVDGGQRLDVLVKHILILELFDVSGRSFDLAEIQGIVLVGDEFHHPGEDVIRHLELSIFRQRSEEGTINIDPSFRQNLQIVYLNHS